MPTISRQIIENLRRDLVGKRIRFLGHREPDPRPLTRGVEGVVQMVDDAGTIHPLWDNGRTLGLVYGIDEYEVVGPSRKELVEQYIQLRVQTRMYDAQNSTSYEQEFEHCYRHGCPDPNTMSDKELRDEIKTCQESLEDETPTCQRCGSPLVEGYCQDETCPYSDHLQTDITQS